MHQQNQTGIRRVDQPHFQVNGFPQQHLQGPVILRVVAAVLDVWDQDEDEQVCYWISSFRQSADVRVEMKSLPLAILSWTPNTPCVGTADPMVGVLTM